MVLVHWCTPYPPTTQQTYTATTTIQTTTHMDLDPLTGWWQTLMCVTLQQPLLLIALWLSSCQELKIQLSEVLTYCSCKHANADAHGRTQTHTDEHRHMQMNARQTASSVWADATSRRIKMLDVCSRTFGTHYTFKLCTVCIPAWLVSCIVLPLHKLNMITQW